MTDLPSTSPRASTAVGALCVSASAVLISVSATSPGTASFWRTVLALPALFALAAVERRRDGPERPARLVAWSAGALFAGDMLLWTQAISEIGAGMSTVLVNVQVVLVPLLALLIDGEHPTWRYTSALPVLAAGVVLTAGVVDGGGSAPAPVAGAVHAVLAAVCYSGFLYLLRRGGGAGAPLRSYADVTVSAVVFSLLVGAVWHGVDLTPGWPAFGWLALVALTGQVLGWLLVALASPHLPGQTAAVLLLLTPVGAVVLGAVVLGERPTPLQAAGCALVLAGAYWASTGRRVPVGSARPPGRG
ncbi:DMT family transporter [Pseudonocardia adelaidensis]|uniref:DMT family transporter n=1 Tax=Pseudonocardia adelaidensis TaxID=648754 RepID=A0ABP9NFZ9_9PSEU